MLKYRDVTERLERLAYIYANHGIGAYPKVLNMTNEAAAENSGAEDLIVTEVAKVAVEQKKRCILVVTRHKGRPSWKLNATWFSFPEKAIQGTSYASFSARELAYSHEDTWLLASGSMASIHKILITIHEFTGVLLKLQEERKEG